MLIDVPVLCTANCIEVMPHRHWGPCYSDSETIHFPHKFLIELNCDIHVAINHDFTQPIASLKVVTMDYIYYIILAGLALFVIGPVWLPSRIALIYLKLTQVKGALCGSLTHSRDLGPCPQDHQGH